MTNPVHYGFTCDACQAVSVPDSERTWIDNAVIDENGETMDACLCLTCRGKYEQSPCDKETDFRTWLKEFNGK